MVKVQYDNIKVEYLILKERARHIFSKKSPACLEFLVVEYSFISFVYLYYWLRNFSEMWVAICPGLSRARLALVSRSQLSHITRLLYFRRSLTNFGRPLLLRKAFCEKTSGTQSWVAKTQGGGGVGGGGTWPIFRYKGAAEGLRPWPRLVKKKKTAKIPSLCRTTPSILRPCLALGQIHLYPV